MKIRVAVVYGGRSGEHEISLRSADTVMKSLDPERYQIVPYFIDKEGRWEPQPIAPEPNANPEIDVVFPVLHGTFGEDGTIQGLFEMAGLPYVGCGVLASSLAMDKDMAKRVLAGHGVLTAEYVTIFRENLDPSEAIKNLTFPMFVKPANLGSSLGISKVKNEAELRVALIDAAQYDRKVIVERAIIGKELETAVLGNDNPEATIPCQIIPSREFYDYEDKYLLDKAKIVLPAPIGQEKTAELRQIAVKAYQALGCEGMARVDFLLEEATGHLYLNEINTIPGFTSISMYPKMWENMGLPIGQLVDRLIELAMQRDRIKKATKFTK